MDFESAFKIAFTKTKEVDHNFYVSSQTAKIAAFIWDIIASAENKFDNLVYIDKENNVITIGQKSKPSKKVEKTTSLAVEGDGEKEAKTE